MGKLDELRIKLLELQTENTDVMVAIEELQAELDKLEQDAKTRSREAMLWPQVGDEYWYIDDLGDKENVKWWGNDTDHYRLATGNCHRTEAEAIAYRKWQTDPRVVARGMIERMEGFDPQGDWRIAADSAGCLYVTNVLNMHGAPRYTHKHLARRAIETLGESLCKVALGVITDKEEAGRIVREAMGNASDSGEAMGE